MTKQTINVGTSPNDNRGDSLRAAFQKINANFTELYTALGLDVAPLNLGAFEFNGSVLSTTDSTAITIDQATTITSNLTVGGDILPSVAYGGDLGSAAKPWKSLYVSGSTIYLGNATLSVDAYGEISINNNRLVQDNGNYIRLNSNVNDVNVSDPQPGDTLQWGPGYWINVPNSDHKLVGNGAEVVLFTDGPEPYTLFPAISTDDQLQIVGSEISSVSGDLALTSPTDTLIISNGAGVGGGSKLWTFGANGSLTLPGGTDTITNINDGLDLSVLGMDEETVLTVNLSRNGALTVPFAINFNPFGTNAGFIGPQPNEIVIAGVPNTSIRIAPNDGANGTFLFGTDGSLTIPGDIKSNGNINIDINLSDSTLRRWQFGEDGNLTFPDGTTQSTAYTGGNANTGNIEFRNDTINDVNGVAITNASQLIADTARISIPANGSGNILITNDTKTWSFDNNGDITIPGNIRSENAINIDINLSDSTLRRWQFSEDGILTLPSTGKISNGGYDWTFETNGDLRLPTGWRISSNQINTGAFGTVTSISLITESLSVDRRLEIYSESNRLHLDSHNPTTELYIGDNSQFIALQQSGEIFVSATGGLSLHGGGENSYAKVVIPKQADAPSTSLFVKNAGNAGVRIEAGPMNYSWNFRGSDGVIVFPDNTVQTTAWLGTADVVRNVTSLGGTVSIQTASQQGDPDKTWLFKHDGGGSLILTDGSTIRARHGFNILATDTSFVNFTSIRNFDSLSFLDLTNIVIINPTAGMLDAIDPASPNCTAVIGATIRLMLTNGVVHNYQLASTFVGEQNNPFYGLPVWTATIPNSGIASTSIKEVSIEHSANWRFDTAGSLTFPDETVQTTAYQKVSSLADQDVEVTFGVIGIRITNDNGCYVQIRATSSLTAHYNIVFSGNANGTDKGTASLTTSFSNFPNTALNDIGSKVDALVKIDSLGVAYRIQILTGSASAPYNNNLVVIERVL